MTPALQNAFALQAAACENLGSAFMHRMLGLILDCVPPGSALEKRLRDWPEDLLTAQADAVALRLCGGLHALKILGNEAVAAVYPPNATRDNALRAALKHVMAQDEAHLLTWLDLPPQTNEVRRAAVLIAAGHWLAARYDLPLVLSELGASGGLNLNWDAFRLDAAGMTFGPQDAAVRLAPDWRGDAPVAGTVRIAEAQGVDLNPLPPEDPQSALRLMAYLWPDQQDRIDRTRAAIDLARDRASVTLVRGDAVAWLPSRLVPVAGAVRMIYSTVAWQYLPATAREAGENLIAAAGAKATDDSPLAWFRMEQDATGLPGAGLTLRLWPGDLTLSCGRVDFHGRWVEWTSPVLGNTT